MNDYDHKEIEKRWQKEWQKNEVYKTVENSDKPKCYVLDMFPYPSGDGLHVGHPKGYIATDIYSRYKKMTGHNILHPMGWDAFGLPAENYAIKNKVHPKAAVEKNVARFKEQLGKIGFNYDWSREIDTTDPEYYRWTQWIFLKLFEKGLAYESHEPINWCPSCQTGLANEDLEAGKCERCGSDVEKKPIRQWVLRITDYADKLLEGLPDLNWPESIKESQRNWIGKSEGAEIGFKIISNPTPPLTPPQKEGENADADQEPFPLGRAGMGEFGYQTTDPKTWQLLHDKVVEMRNNPTPAEEKLWQVLKGNNLGCHFRRQHIIGKFIVDFVCLENNLVIEVDGDVHDYQKEADQERTEFLEGSGFRVVRFKNEEVLNNLDDVVSRIKALPFGEGLGGVVTVFTTRPDTIFGATYVVLAPEHALVEKLLGQVANADEVRAYMEMAAKKDEITRTDAGKEKTGVELKGVKTINPANGEEIPVYIADYVLVNYGTGAIMAVPAHDDRDLAFALKYNLPIKDVIGPSAPGRIEAMRETGVARPYYGPLINSGEFDGLESEEAKEKITKAVGGKMTTTYRLKDWVFSRQRYWGEPIPLIHCEACGVVPVPEDQLPVKLPEVEHYEPTGTGESPLAGIDGWVNTTCPKCGGAGKRETNTMPQWAGSCWYYLRFIDPKNAEAFVDKEKEKYWSPVDMYVGGAEHATRHLIYARFWHKFLFDIGAVSKSEPFMALKHVGLIQAEDGRKMSKRWGNVINPDDIIELYGADTLRLYEMFMGPFDQNIAWSTESMIGPRRFVEKVWRLQGKVGVKGTSLDSDSQGAPLTFILNQTIQKVGEDIGAFRFNTAISQLMILVNEMEKQDSIEIEDYKILLKLLAPFAPHVAEEIWRELGGSESIHLSEWPSFDESKLESDEIKIAVQVNGKVRAVISTTRGVDQEEVLAEAKALDDVAKWLGDNPLKKVIFVPDKLINIVI